MVKDYLWSVKGNCLLEIWSTCLKPDTRFYYILSVLLIQSVLRTMNIFVAKIKFSVDEQQLLELFEEYGEVSSAKIVTDRDTGRSKGFGFVEMPNDDEANAAIQALNEMDYEGMPLVVKEARPREDSGRRDNRGGGGGWNRDRR